MSSPPLEWSNEKLLKFLELYKSERLIWDPRAKNHKMTHKVQEAWNRISTQMNDTPITELKLKKKSLMATFRPLFKKKIASIRSGAGADDVFQPIWFLYETMERFLGTLYDVDEIINTGQRNSSTQYEAQSPDVKSLLQSPLSPQQISSPSQSVPSSSQAGPSSTPVWPKKNRKRPRLDKDGAQNKISQTLDTLNQVLKDKTHTNEKDEDECDLYVKLLAKRLRKYPESMRGVIMYQIDGLLLQNPYPTIEHQIDRPSSVLSYDSSLTSSQSQFSDHQPYQRVYIQPTGQSDTSVEIKNQEMSPEN